MSPPAHKKRKLVPQFSGHLEHGISDGEIPGESSQERDMPRSKSDPLRAGNGPMSLGNGAYNTNLFQLQLDQLLSKVRPDYERRMVRAENALRKLKTIIERIPNHEAKPVR